MRISLGQHQIMIEPLNGTSQRLPVTPHSILGTILLMGLENSSPMVKMPFPFGECFLLLFLRLADTFLTHVSILNQITLSGLAGLGATLIIKVAMHISVLIYPVLTSKFKMLETLSCLSFSSPWGTLSFHQVLAAGSPAVPLHGGQHMGPAVSQVSLQALLF